MVVKMSSHKNSYTTGQAAKYCHVTPVAVFKWIKAGRLKAFQTPGRHYRIPPEELVRFMEKYQMPIPDELIHLQTKRILVVDDDKTVVDVITRGLEQDEYNYEIELAYDGFEAATQLFEFKPDLVILDIKMPGLDGFSVCRRIRNNPQTKDIKILGITAYLDKVEEFLECGADDCLIKPLRLEELKARVAQLLFEDKILKGTKTV